MHNKVELRKYFFSDFVTINPFVSLNKNQNYSFIEMKDLSDGQRFAYPSIERKLSGGARFEEGDTLFARITPCLENGKICQAKELKEGKGFGSTEFLVFRGKENVSNSNFVFYLSRWDEVRKYAEANLVGTSGRQRVPKDVFDKLELELPDLKTQSRIASILSSLDDKIELNRRMIQTLEQMVQALFNHYFVDNIDPDNLPEGWRIGRFNDLVEVWTGKGLKRNEFDENGLYNVHGANGIIGKANKFLSENKVLLTGRVGTLGTIQLVSDKVWISDNVLVCEPKDYINLYYSKFVLSSFDFHGLNRGSTQPLISQSDLKNQIVLLPSKETLSFFHRMVNNFYEKIINNNKEIKSLAKIRDILLPQLMSGEIDVETLMKEEVIPNELVENLKTA